MEKFSAEQAAEIMRKARENIERPVEISPAPLPPPESRADRHRREIAEAEQRHTAEHAQESEVAALWGFVLGLRAEVEDLRGDLLNLARASNEVIGKIAEVGEDRERLIGTLRDQLHDARLDLANVRSDLSALRLALADQRAVKTALDLPDPLSTRRLQ
jgi:hypothetical protein